METIGLAPEQRLGLANSDVVVMGLGFVGLPLALSYALAGRHVVGVDINEAHVQALLAGQTTVLEDHNGRSLSSVLAECLANGTFVPTTDVRAAIASTTNIIVTIGMPVVDGQVIRRPLLDAIRSISLDMQPGTLVLIRSTVIPGTTEEVILPMLESAGRILGRDFYLAYAPERIAEGKAFEEFANMPTVVAGCDAASAERAKALLRHIVVAPLVDGGRVPAAELTKVFENIQRDVNIAMVQVFARVCEAMGLNSMDVVNLANTHKRVKLLVPGPGVGGFCLPNAVHYLVPKAQELGVDVSFLKAAREINEGVPHTVAQQVLTFLATKGRPPVGAKIAVIGLAMKDFSSDARLSPPVETCRLLVGHGCDVYAYDPVVPRTLEFHKDSLSECLDGAEVLVLLAKQEGFTLPSAAELANAMASNPIVIDTRNWFRDESAGTCGVKVWRI